MSSDRLINDLACNRWLFISGLCQGAKWGFVIMSILLVMLAPNTPAWGFFLVTCLVSALLCWTMQVMARKEHKHSQCEFRERRPEKGTQE